MVDSIGKKLKVIDAVCSQLKIENITTIHSRAEDIKTQKFDVAVSRAVAPLKNLWQWTKPLLRKSKNKDAVNGLICLKGGDLAAEISESGLHPQVFEISDIFKEEWFMEKYILYTKL